MIRSRIQVGLFRVRIPAKANSIPEGSRTGFRAGPEQQSERSDAGFLIVQEVFGLVKETGRSGGGPERSGGRRLGARKGVRGKGQQSRSPLGTGETRRRQPTAYAPPPRFLRIESPFISMRWALWTRRSRIPSATVGSPTCSCQRATGSCEVRIIERVW